MRIAIDATPLTVAAGGIRRYVVELTRALALSFPEDDFFLISDQVFRLPEGLGELSNVLPHAGLGTGFRRRWWSLGLPWELKRLTVDVFHGADFSVPYVPLTPSVLVMHDLSPWRRGLERAEGADRIRRRTPFLLPLATKIVTPSQAIRSELIETFGVPRARVTAVPLAAADVFSPRPPDVVGGVLRNFGIQTPYLLALAGNARKNLPVLLSAWRLVRRKFPAIGLVIVGVEGGPNPTSSEPGLQPFSYISDPELASLLSAAEAFVYPSFYEGFGLPVLEAMRSGAAVVTSADPAIVEVAGGAALHVDASSSLELSNAIVEVLANSNLRARLIEKGAERASRFSWRSAAVSTREVYEQAVRRF